MKRVWKLAHTKAKYLTPKTSTLEKIKITARVVHGIARTVKVLFKKPDISSLPNGSILLQDERPDGLIAYNKYMGRWYHGHGREFADPLEDASQLHNNVFLYMGLYVKPKRVLVR